MSKKLSRNSKAIVPVVAIGAALAALAWYVHGHTVAVLSPAGEIARKERNLMAFALLLSALVVLPVFTMAIVIAAKYRESNHAKKNLKYSPDWDRSRLFESLWWGVPCAIIIVLSVVTWNSSHALDPYRALASAKKPLTVQVICLDWKWLFIYPEQHIATTNLVEIPVNTPVNFQITSDAVMNSFWIPQLSGQIYAMPGMSTQLHLMADKTGSFYGSPANIAGSGFARMTFTAKSVSQTDFNNWIMNAQASSKELTTHAYSQLAKPSDNYPVTYYSTPMSDLYNDVVMKYMMPNMNDKSSKSSSAAPKQSGSMSNMQGMYMP